MPSISTERANTFHLNSLNTRKNTTHDVRNPGPDLRQTQKCDGVKPVNVIPSPRWWIVY